MTTVSPQRRQELQRIAEAEVDHLYWEIRQKSDETISAEEEDLRDKKRQEFFDSFPLDEREIVLHAYVARMGLTVEPPFKKPENITSPKDAAPSKVRLGNIAKLLGCFIILLFAIVFYHSIKLRFF